MYLTQLCETKPYCQHLNTSTNNKHSKNFIVCLKGIACKIEEAKQVIISRRQWICIIRRDGGREHAISL